MNQKVPFLLLLVVCVSLHAIGAIPTKINLLLVDVGTIDTVAKTEKFMAARDKVLTKAPPKPTVAENVVDPSLQKTAVRLNWLTGVAEYCRSKREVEEENARRREILEGLRNSIVGNSENRFVVIAKDYLASGLEPYSDFISVVDRSDASLSEVEKAISNQDQTEVAPATLFLSVTLGDLQHVKKSIQVGDTLVQRDAYTRKATAKVSDFNNVRAFSCDVTAKYEKRQTDAMAVQGENAMIAEAIIEDAMKQIAKKVGERFVREFHVNVILPKGSEDEIGNDSIQLYVDRVTNGKGDVIEEGIPVTPGEPFKALAINHTVTAILEDQKFVLNQKQISLGTNRSKGTFRVRNNKK